MEHTQHDLKLAILHIKHLEERISQQRAKIARIREDGFPTRPEEEELAAFLRALDLLKNRLADLTDPLKPQKFSN